MPTLLLRLAAPLQSWGCSSKFEVRTTEMMPTKSGVVGMLAAALGMRRDGNLSELNALKFGVRADREGEDIVDFQMAHEEAFYKKHKSEYTHVTYRHYLTDAVFLVGLEGDVSVLKVLEAALYAPKYPLFLGRRSCPPTLPLVIGIRDLSLEEALCKEKPLCTRSCKEAFRIQVESNEINAGMIQDVPLSFHPDKRVFGYRKVKEYFTEGSSHRIEHDAMSELG